MATGFRKMNRVINCTPHAVRIVDYGGGLVVKEFPKDGTLTVRAQHIVGGSHEPIRGCPVRQAGVYQLDEAAWEACKFQKGDAIIVSSIAAEVARSRARKEGIEILVPATGPGQCLRDPKTGEILGSYFFLHYD